MRKSTLVFVLLCLVGLVDSTYLAWDHLQALTDPAFGGGLCASGGGCDISRTSAASEIPLGSLGPGLPIAILGLGFYLAFLALLVFRARRPEDPTPPRLLLALGVLSSAYAIALLVLSLVVQGELCPLCTVLYVVNLGLLVTAWVTLGEPIGSWLKRVWGAVPTAATAVAAAVFIAGVVAAYAIYALALADAPAHGALPDAAVSVDVTGRPTKGSPTAPVHIVEFADIECGHCHLLFKTLEALQRDRPQDVRVTFMNFPLDKACNPAVTRDFHVNACWLATVAVCAGDQGKEYEALSLLFEDHKGKQEDLTQRVVDLGLDKVALLECMASDATRKRIASDIDEGLKLGITGTPVFFVNGHKVVGARSRADLEKMVDDAMKSAPPAGQD